MIIEDPDLMLIPIDDKSVNRAHSCFDALNFKNFRFYNIKMHLDRLENSAKQLQIKLPKSKEEIHHISKELAKFSYKKLSNEFETSQLKEMVFQMRYFVSSGRGDFSVASLNSQPCFYASVMLQGKTHNLPENSENQIEFTMRLDDKAFNLSNVKTTNYQKSAILANYSQSLGGYIGIMLNENNEILESTIANNAVFLKNGDFVVTPQGNILERLTLKKILNYCKNDLINKKIIKQISVRYINIEEIYNEAQEVLTIGGGKILPITMINDKVIGNGTKGKVCTLLQDWYYNHQELGIYDKIIDENSLQ